MSTASFLPSLAPPVPAQFPSKRPRIGLLSPYPPSMGGVATFSASLCKALSADGIDVSVARVVDGAPSLASDIAGAVTDGSADSFQGCIEILNKSDIAIIQFDMVCTAASRATACWESSTG